MDYKANRFQLLCVSITMILFVGTSASALQLSSIIMLNGDIYNNAYAKKYSTNFEQATSLVNDCPGDQESSEICVNNNPQTQGRDNVISTPISSQIEKPVDEGEEGPNQELQVRQVEGTSTQIEPLDDGTAIAECDSEEFVTGGGYAIFGIVSDAVIEQESAVSGPPPGWSLSVANTGPSAIQVQAFAECATLVDAL